MNDRELVSLNALVAYTAFEKKVSEASVRRTVTSRFGVVDMRHLPGRAYEDVIRFLVDLQIDMLAH